MRESKKYYQLVSGQVDLLLENLEIWLTGIEATRAMSSIEGQCIKCQLLLARVTLVTPV